jgi:hypothetical protein
MKAEVRTAPPTTIERYFSLHYGAGLARRTGDDPAAPPPPASGEDTVVARHHNGICVLCLSPSHPVVRQGLRVTAVAFRSGIVRPVQGKRKRGGTFLDRDSRLASVVCEGGETYLVSASVKGVLVEVNAALERSPGLVASKPLTNGYLAVILPSHGHRERAAAHLLDEDPAGPAP